LPYRSCFAPFFLKIQEWLPTEPLFTATRLRHSAQGCPPTAGYPGSHVWVRSTTLKGLRLFPESRTMPQSLANVVVHLIFSTKDRRPLLRDVELRRAMHKYLGGTSGTLNCNPIIVGGIEDHVHLLAQQARTISISEWVKELKRVTSLWAKEHDSRLRDFQWQAGYGAFSVSQSEVGRVELYIQQQEEHHRKFDFKTEYRTLLERHRIEFDERYVWD